jgi:hypothetical protein
MNKLDIINHNLSLYTLKLTSYALPECKTKVMSIITDRGCVRIQAIGAIMKYNKLISITLFNSFFLLIFTCFVASCDKKTIQSKGMLTNFNKLPSRSIASIKSKTKKRQFINFQDPKQIIVYCTNNSKRIKQCYNKYFAEILADYKVKFGPLSGSQITLIKENYQYNNINEKLNTMNKNIDQLLTVNIQSIVVKREDFCKANSKKYLKKCLTQYLSRDTFAILNKFQFEHRKMNAHEYIYYKNIIQSNFESKLKLSYNQLK